MLKKGTQQYRHRIRGTGDGRAGGKHQISLYHKDLPELQDCKRDVKG